MFNVFYTNIYKYISIISGLKIKKEHVIICAITIFSLILLRKFQLNMRDYLAAKRFLEISGFTKESLEEDAGIAGEFALYKKLWKYEKRGAFILCNLYVPRKNGKLTEIDIVMITRKGIFVFESKNYHGLIYGREEDMNWTQLFHRKNNLNYNGHFYNPVKQNRTHTNYIRWYLKTKVPMHSVVVFSDTCTLKRIKKKRGTNVVQVRNIDKKIKRIQRKTKEVIDWDTMKEIYEKLNECTHSSYLLKGEHMGQINSYIQKRQKHKIVNVPAAEKDNELKKGWICPRCKTVHSPEVLQCDCKPEDYCIHEWSLEGIVTNGTKYRCLKCGETLLVPVQ